MSFNKDDVVTIVNAMLENHTVNIWDHNKGNYTECIHCETKHDDPSKIKHDLDCPVLIASNVLTCN